MKWGDIISSVRNPTEKGLALTCSSQFVILMADASDTTKTEVCLVCMMTE